MKKLLLFGGTTEGRLLAQKLCQQGHAVTVSVATALGAEELRELPVAVLTGRLDQGEMEALIPDFQMVIDATHPYAREVSRNLRSACHSCGVPLRRVLREESPAQGCVRVGSCAEAAEFLKGQSGNVLIATGAKELAAFAGLEPGRLYARVLPTHEGLSACEALGLPHRNILALQGPFTRRMNAAMLEQYHVRWLVTKDGGRAGGFAEKLAAAQEVGASLVLVERPREDGASMEELLAELQGV